MLYLCTRFQEQSNCEARAFSSAGLEHLPYKQRVGGSNPSTPTQSEQVYNLFAFLFTYYALTPQITLFHKKTTHK